MTNEMPDCSDYHHSHYDHIGWRPDGLIHNYWLDCGGCGLIVLNKDGMVVGGAPYFLKFLRGKHLLSALGSRYYRLENIDE